MHIHFLLIFCALVTAASGTALDSMREANDIASYDPGVDGWRLSFPSPVKMPSDTIHVAQICSDPQQCKEPAKPHHVGILNCTQVVAALQYEQWLPVFSTCPFDGGVVLPTNPAIAFSPPNDIILQNSSDLMSASRSRQHNMSTVFVRLVSVSRVDSDRFFTSINARTVDLISPSPTFSHLYSQHKCVQDGFFFVPNHAILVWTEAAECEWTCGVGFLKRPWIRKAQAIKNFAQCVSIPDRFFSMSFSFKITTTLADENRIEEVLAALSSKLEKKYPNTLFFSKLVGPDGEFELTNIIKQTASQSTGMQNADIVDQTPRILRRRLLQTQGENVVETIAISDDALSETAVSSLPKAVENNILNVSNHTTAAVSDSAIAIAKIEAPPLPPSPVPSASPAPNTTHNETWLITAIIASILLFGGFVVYFVCKRSANPVRDSSLQKYKQVHQTDNTIRASVITWKFDNPS